MPKPMNDDLFQGSTMTFGEHLEELRTVLVRAMLGLLIGCLIGFSVANPLVRTLEKPLSQALKKHYQIQAEKLKQARLSGDVTAETTAMIQEYSLVPDTVYVDRHWLNQMVTGAASSASTSPATSTNPAAGPRLVEMPIWRAAAGKTQSFGMTEPFMIWVKAAMIAGIVISSPWIFFQAWSFVAVGLYPHERNYIYLFLPLSLGLFLAGTLLAFFFAMSPVLDFLLQFNRQLEIDPFPRVSEWMSFVLLLPLGFGISFQLPLVMLFLERIGVFTATQYVSQWRIAVLAIFVIAMILTPSPDPYSMLLMAVPLTALYFGGVALCRWLPSRAKRVSAET